TSEAGSGFTDVPGSSVHIRSVEAVRAAGITSGCSQQPLRFCPDRPVTRAQMATFLTRALSLPVPPQPADG
ncbi:MAG: S-layer homology domain-containing protein, partial [Acidimicrobiia bacterium]|nr:S-layer homology domain-containing protein [Acidimicrobiia bacterium]